MNHTSFYRMLLGAGLCLILCNQLSAQTQKKTAWSKAGNLAHLLITDLTDHSTSLKGGMYRNRSIRTIMAGILGNARPPFNGAVSPTYMEKIALLLDSVVNVDGKQQILGNLRPDITFLEGNSRQVWEIKVNTPANTITKGRAQLDRYIEFLNLAYKRATGITRDFTTGGAVTATKERFIFEVKYRQETKCLCMYVQMGQNAPGIIVYDWNAECDTTATARSKFAYNEANKLIKDVQPVLNAIYKLERNALTNAGSATGETILEPSENGALFGEDAADYPLD